MNRPEPPLPGRRRRRAQSGFLLLEAMIAILIFSVGILGLIGLQSASVKQATAAEDRAVAAQLANDLISRMWAGNHATLSTDFGADGASYASWLSAVSDSRLPGITRLQNAPRVTFSTGPTGLSGITPATQAQILIQWQAPNETVVHQYTAIAVIK